MLTVLHTEEERGQVQTCFWGFIDVGFWWKNIKKCLFRKNYIQRFAKKDHYMVWKIRLLEYQLIDSAWHKFGSVPDSLKKTPRFWCKFIYWVKLICRYQSHVLLNQSYKCNM